MKYDLFLFDADDTLFDFKSCELKAFQSTLSLFGKTDAIEPLYKTYRQESLALWRDLEQGKISKEYLKTERFSRTFAKHNLNLPVEQIGDAYLEMLPQTCVLIDHALEICQFLSAHGRIGIITNGFEIVQTQRLKGSALAPFIHFMVVSEQCGFIKPDVRFFEHTAKLVEGFNKQRTLVIGDRLETDIAGAHAFGVDACWFNPAKQIAEEHKPKYEIHHLSELKDICL